MVLRLHKRIARLTLWLPVLWLAAGPVAGLAADKDLTEIKFTLNDLIGEIRSLQMQIATLRGKFDLATNSLQGDLASVQVSLQNLKSALETGDGWAAGGFESTSARQVQFVAAVGGLSNSVSQLSGMIDEWKAGGPKTEYKNEVDRQLVVLTTQLSLLTNTMLGGQPGLDQETRNDFALLKDDLAHGAGAAPGWIPYTLLGLVAASLGLTGWMLASFHGKLAVAEQKSRETRDVMARFGLQMEARVKTMEGSSVAVQTTAKEVTDSLERVESAIGTQLETVAQLLNSSQLAELAGGATRTTEQMTRLRSETAELQTFMNGLQQTTKRWIADFEKQSGQALDRARHEMQALDQLVWPQPFRGANRLGAARERIQARATHGDKAAFALVLGLGQLQLALVGREENSVVEALDRLGALAYRFWKGEADASVEAAFEAAQAWAAEINRLLVENKLPVSIRIIMPRAGFDMATMLSEQTLTGTTVRVREPLSWAVVSQSPGHTKVLVTGKVITE